MPSNESRARKSMLRVLVVLTALSFCGALFGQIQVTSDKSVRDQIKHALPSKGGPVPADLARRLGATHSDGMYHLTDEPFLVEGAEKLSGLGFGVAKFWLSHTGKGYDWNSSWGDMSHMTLAQIVDMPYYQRALRQPFTTVMFELGTDGKSIFSSKHDFAADQEEIRQLTVYLLKTYHDRDITFVIQNWEGDWVFRGDEKDGWPPGDKTEVERRAQAMTRWFSARQAGVEQGRAEVPDAKCKVLHAIEVNKVFDSVKRIPTLTNMVLTQVPVDLVSWSSWDGKDDPVLLWQGIEILRAAAKPLPGVSQTPVYIGEIGLAENTGMSASAIRDWWDERMAVLFALKVPYIVDWELYCNEPKDKDKSNRRMHTASEMTGKWLLRPDGSHSHALDYFEELLARSRNQH